MKHISQHINEALDKKSVVLDAAALVDAVNSKSYVEFDNLEPGSTAQNMSKPDEVYKILSKYYNFETAKSNIEDVDSISKNYVASLEDAPKYASSLPVVLVQHNNKRMIMIYSPEMHENVETLIVLDK